MKQPFFIPFFILIFAVFLLTVLISRRLIPRLRSLKMGQKILDIGPRWHKSKEGTPTMGGLAFLAASVLGTAAVTVYEAVSGNAESLRALIPLWLAMLLALGSGLVGLIDDRCKITKRQNEGLSAPAKFFLQLIVAGIYLLLVRLLWNPSTTLVIPFFDYPLELGIFYYVVGLVLITGIVNSVNLTDGIDGLSSSEVFVVGCFFALVSFTVASKSGAYGSALAIGSALGFLVYNIYPARVFMGDTGSLFFGGLLVGLAYTVGNPLIVLFAGFMFVAETVSVMIQTTYFKYTRIRTGTGKRIFKMTPLHHHFELSGWKEMKIVAVFSIVALIFCALSYILDYIVF